MDSVLNTIKKLLGISENYTQFDVDVLTYINMSINVLNQLGVKLELNSIDSNTTWEDLITDIDKIQMIKSFIFIKVKMIFDPPSSGSISESYNSILNELTWRINSEVDF